MGTAGSTQLANVIQPCPHLLRELATQSLAAQRIN